VLFGVGFVSACEVDLLWYEIPFNRPIDCQDSFLALNLKSEKIGLWKYTKFLYFRFETRFTIFYIVTYKFLWL
jgi:hypothetical protein